MQLDNDKLKQSVLIVAIFALGGLLFWFLRGFLTAFLGALVFYILLRIPYFYLTETIKKKWNKMLTAASLMIVSFVVLVLPVMLISLVISGKISYLVHHYEDILQIAQQWSANAKDYIGTDLLTGDSINKFTSIAAELIPKLLSATVRAVVDVFVVYFLLFFMLINARDLEKEIKEYLPFHDSNNTLLLHELRKQTTTNSIGIGVLVIVQGLVATLGYLLFGIKEPGVWGAVTGIASAIPVVGTGIAWIPICIILYVSGQHYHAIGLAFYCGIILSAIETGFRLIVTKKLGNIHPLITFFGVIMGVDLFGIVGVIFGPLLISYFLLLLKIYRNEYLGIPH